MARLVNPLQETVAQLFLVIGLPAEIWDRVERRKMEKECPVCGKKFETVYPFKKYCSSECAEEHNMAKKRALWNLPHDAVCPVCGTKFIWKHRNKKYCSKACYRKANREHVAKARKPVRKYQADLSLTDAAIEARKEGLSYGQWMQKHGRY